MTPDTTRHMNRRYQLFSQYILPLDCPRVFLVWWTVVYCRILQGPRCVLCSARCRQSDYRTQGPDPCDDGDWSQESSEQVLRNTTLRGVSPALERTLAAYTTIKMLPGSRQRRRPGQASHVPLHRGRRSSYETFKSAQTFIQEPRLACRASMGVKVEKIVLDNTERTNDLGGGK